MNKYQNHKYGENVVLLASPRALHLLAQLGDPKTEQPLINELVKELYSILFHEMVDLYFPKTQISIPTRMIQYHPEGIYQGEAIDSNTKVVTVGLARAGTLPSQVFYDKLNYLLKPTYIRQDHIYVSRATNEKNEVIGACMSGSKIGGDVENSIVLLPDPMGATGGTIAEICDYYLKNIQGKPKLIIATHLIITPEYIKKIKATHPHIKILALRLDRGLSSPDILKTVPGTFIDQEKGLNATDYIVPGAGGLGEILNNSYC
jgi:uracil phosphoribosyltransferase